MVMPTGVARSKLAQSRLILLVSVFAFAANFSALRGAVEAQIPAACGMTDATAVYGPIVVGSTVQLGMHTPWQGDANWTAEMNRWVGATAVVVRINGVDAAGCPTVRVNVDGGQFSWRIRDMRLLSGPAPTGDPIPRFCGMRAPTVQFGAIQPGVTVILGAHTFAGPGDDLNWAAEMSRWAGTQAVVTSLAGTDTYGCPVVRVSVDGGQFAWRIRDMQIVPTAIPMHCGMVAGAVQYGPIRPGSLVILGAHTADVGDPNWAGEMSRWVGMQTIVTSLSGVDGQGCPTVRVAADGGRFAWRIRNMTFLR